MHRFTFCLVVISGVKGCVYTNSAGCIFSLSGSPTYPDMSLLSMQSRPPGGESMTTLASRLQWEQYRRMFPSPMSHHRGFSPASLTGLPPGVFLPHPATTPYSQRSVYSDIPPTPGSGSITLPGSLESKLFPPVLQSRKDTKYCDKILLKL